jgi:hypothetical protein
MKKSPVNDDMGSAKLTKMLRDHENRVKAEATMNRDELNLKIQKYGRYDMGRTHDDEIAQRKEILSAFDSLTAKVNQLESGELYVQLSAERGKVLELTAERDSLKVLLIECEDKLSHCPICHRDAKEEGYGIIHASDCELNAAIGESK